MLTSPTPAELQAMRARWTGPGTILADSVTVRQAIDDITVLLDALESARAALAQAEAARDLYREAATKISDEIAARAHLGGQARKEG